MKKYKQILSSIFITTVFLCSNLFAENSLPQQLKIPEHNSNIKTNNDNKLNEELLNNIITPPTPDLEASSFILIDFDSGEVIANKDSDKKVPPASLTKIMSMYVISNEIKAGRLQLTDLVNISNKAWKMPGSRMFVEPNTNVPVSELIKGIVIQSGNDATVAMAEHISGNEKEFVELMNYEAQKLNLENTHFDNVTGLPSDNHYSTAKDMAILAKAVISEHPELYNLYKEKVYTYNDIKQYNRNRLLWKKSLNVDGLKTGHTDLAGYCQVTSATKDGNRLIAVVMGSKSEEKRAKNNEALIKHGFKYYETKKVFTKDKEMEKISVLMGQDNSVPVGVLNSTYITIPKDTSNKLKYFINIKSQLTAPIKKYESIGFVSIELDNKVIKQVPMFTLKEVKTGNIWSRFKDYVSSSVVSLFSSKKEMYTKIETNIETSAIA